MARPMDALGHGHVFTMTNAGSCPKCCYVFPPIREAAPAYFEQGYITCSKCQAQADLWSVVLGRALSQPPVPMCLVGLGATETHFTHEIAADKYHEIHLTTAGIPADATVLQVGYTPQGGERGAVFPIELHGNVPQRRIVGNVLRLLGRGMKSGDGTVGSVCPVSIWVVWVHQEKEGGWPYLVSAFEAFIDGHYDRVIVPAQSAVEISLMPVVRELLERHASVDHVKGFMGDRLTFGNVVNVVLPFVCGQAGLPKLPEKIRISLNQLRRLRNTVVHSGTGSEKITAQQAAEGLCAGAFGLEYVKYARPRLLAWLR
jgi:hypothetical protein